MQPTNPADQSVFDMTMPQFNSGVGISNWQSNKPQYDAWGNPMDTSNGNNVGSMYSVDQNGNQQLAAQGSINSEAQIGAIQTDPWGVRGRTNAAGQLYNNMQGNDPAVAYRNKLSQMMNGKFSPDDPSYQWRFDQGQQAVERSGAAKGLMNSGNMAIALTQYGQGMASQEYAAQFSRLLSGMSGVESQYNTSQSRLMELAGVGNANLRTKEMEDNTQQGNNLSEQSGIRQAFDNNGGTSPNPYAGYSFG